MSDGNSNPERSVFLSLIFASVKTTDKPERFPNKEENRKYEREYKKLMYKK